MLTCSPKSFIPLVGVLIGLLPSCSKGPLDFIKKADANFKEKKFTEAAINYRKAIQLDPKNGEGHFGLGRAELELEHYQEAWPEFQEAVRLLPDRIDVKAQYADLALARYQAEPENQAMYDLLKSLAAEFLAKDANSFEGLRLKGTLAYLDRKPAEAIELFKRANEIRPMQEYLIVAYTEALLDAGQPAAAEELGRKLIAVKKDFGPIYDVLYRNAIRENRPAAAEAILQEKVRNNTTSGEPTLQLASYYLQSGNRPAAYGAIEKLTEIQPPVSKAHLIAGDFYLQLQELEKAQSHYEQGAKAEPAQQYEANKRIARVQIAQGKTDAALKLLDQVIAKQPQDQDAVLMKANLMVNQGDPDEVEKAIGLLQGVLKARPGDRGVMQSLGRAYIGKGDYPMARSMLQDTLQNNSLAEESRVLLASVDILDKKSQNAMTALDTMIEKTPGNARARFLKFAALMELRRYDDARSVMDKLVQEFPNSKDFRLQQGILAILSRRYPEAEAIFTKLASDRSDIRAVSGLTETFVARQQYDRALQVLEGEIGKSKDPDSIRLILARTASLAGKYDRAVTELQKLKAAHPDNPELLTALGDTFRQQEKFPEALENLQKAAQLAPKDPKTNLLLGMAYYQTGKANEAMAAYRVVLQAEPTNSIVMNNLAYSLAEAGSPRQLEEAQTLAERAVQLQPSADNRDTLGYVFLKRGMADNAIRNFEVLARRFPKNPSYQHHLGLALLLKKDEKGARTALQAALGNGASPAEAREIKNALNGIK